MRNFTSGPRVIRLAALCLIVGGGGGNTPAAAQSSPAPSVTRTLQALEGSAGMPLRKTLAANTGLLSFLAAGDAAHPIPVAAAATAPAEARARAFLRVASAAFGLGSDKQVSLRSASSPDEVGMEHVRLQQMRNGVPVRGGELTVHLRGATVVAVNAATIAGVEAIETTPIVTAEQARVAAAAMLAKDQQAGITLSKARLEIVNPGHFENRADTSRLAWFIEATGVALRQFIWVDALKGNVLFHFSQLAEARNRQVYGIPPSDRVFPTLPGLLVRSEGEAATGIIVDVDSAYEFSGDTYDYYASQHGRDSFDGAGASLISTVLYCNIFTGCPMANAFWDGTQMVYGDGYSLADDVAAHELTHAVTERSAGLAYCSQSGALNESFSDIFGETVDLTNSGGSDASAVRWKIGEDIPGTGAIRDMSSPGNFGDPERVSDARFQCFNSCDDSNDQGGVHTNSGVPNHAYALMVDGGFYNGFSVGGIGLTKAGKIQYRALTQYLTSTSGFIANYNALQQACSDLVGTVGISANDCIEVKKALDAVEMGGAICGQAPPFCGDGSIDAGEQCDDGNTTSGDGCESDCTFLSCSLYAATDLPKPIPDLSSVTSSIAVSGGGIVKSVSIVDLKGTHSYIGDLRFTVINPQNISAVIVDKVCAGDDNFDLDLSDGASGTITCPATNGRPQIPSTPLAALNGQEADGTWTLRIEDQAGVDVGTLNQWGLLVCRRPCGNGTLDAGETCDDGNLVSGDGCDTNCTQTSCGNGIVSSGEACDDGNLISGDGCDTNCTQTRCGNGIVSSGEACDDGNLISDDGCDANCTQTRCGNGIISSGEACDDANLISGDGCEADCTVSIPPTVTRTFTATVTSTATQTLTPPVTQTPTRTPTRTGTSTRTLTPTKTATSTGTAAPTSTPTATNTPDLCGDSVVSGGETCDDGNAIDGDGCDASCQVEAIDPCVPMYATKLKLSSLPAPGGNDRLSFKGSMALNHPFAPALDPTGRGVRLKLANGGWGSIVDIAIPPGAYDRLQHQGWRSNAGATSWSFVSRAGVQGITKLTLRDKSATSPGLLQVKIKGKNGSYAVVPADLPLRLTLELEQSAQCGRATYPGPDPICKFIQGNQSLTCS